MVAKLMAKMFITTEILGGGICWFGVVICEFERGSGDNTGVSS
jgi:hypothetical protein